MRRRLLTAALAAAVTAAACATPDSIPPPPPASSPTPTPLAAPATTPLPPAQLFIKMGCPTCHAKGAPHEDKLAASVGKPVEEVAAWIRNPESKKPGTVMPTFASRIDETEALTLAAWVQREAALSPRAGPASGQTKP